MYIAQQIITELILMDFDFLIQLTLILTKSDQLIHFIGWFKKKKIKNIPLLPSNESDVISPNFMNIKKVYKWYSRKGGVGNYLMQRVHCIHLVIMVFTNGPMFLSSTARFPSKNRLLSLPNIMDWSLNRLQES